MRVINIGNKDYKFEFTIEASLYDECTIGVTSLMHRMGEAKDKEDIVSMISSMANIPQTTLTMFYAGLLEHHGEDGDGSVSNKKDAKKLIKTYFDEHKEDGLGNFYEVMNMMIEVMVDDGFFEKIGLAPAMRSGQEQASPKTPQDHKKKATKATVN